MQLAREDSRFGFDKLKGELCKFGREDHGNIIILSNKLPYTGFKNQLRKNPHLAPLVVLEPIPKRDENGENRDGWQNHEEGIEWQNKSVN
ncbi:MAG: hypothetical protein K8L91_20610 [Anaerolineae bacterium]|nr:hypothetical protein [Anaerolineae bacterium]